MSKSTEHTPSIAKIRSTNKFSELNGFARVFLRSGDTSKESIEKMNTLIGKMKDITTAHAKNSPIIQAEKKDLEELRKLYKELSEKHKAIIAPKKTTIEVIEPPTRPSSPLSPIGTISEEYDKLSKKIIEPATHQSSPVISDTVETTTPAEEMNHILMQSYLTKSETEEVAGLVSDLKNLYSSAQERSTNVLENIPSDASGDLAKLSESLVKVTEDKEHLEKLADLSKRLEERREKAEKDLQIRLDLADNDVEKVQILKEDLAIDQKLLAEVKEMHSSLVGSIKAARKQREDTTPVLDKAIKAQQDQTSLEQQEAHGANAARVAEMRREAVALGEASSRNILESDAEARAESAVLATNLARVKKAESDRQTLETKAVVSIQGADTKTISGAQLAQNTLATLKQEQLETEKKEKAAGMIQRAVRGLQAKTELGNRKTAKVKEQAEKQAKAEANKIAAEEAKQISMEKAKEVVVKYLSQYTKRQDEDTKSQVIKSVDELLSTRQGSGKLANALLSDRDPPDQHILDHILSDTSSPDMKFNFVMGILVESRRSQNTSNITDVLCNTKSISQFLEIAIKAESGKNGAVLAVFAAGVPEHQIDTFLNNVFAAEYRGPILEKICTPLLGDKQRKKAAIDSLITNRKQDLDTVASLVLEHGTEKQITSFFIQEPESLLESWPQTKKDEILQKLVKNITPDNLEVIANIVLRHQNPNLFFSSDIENSPKTKMISALIENINKDNIATIADIIIEHGSDQQINLLIRASIKEKLSTELQQHLAKKGDLKSAEVIIKIKEERSPSFLNIRDRTRKALYSEEELLRATKWVLDPKHEELHIPSSIITPFVSAIATDGTIKQFDSFIKQTLDAKLPQSYLQEVLQNTIETILNSYDHEKKQECMRSIANHVLEHPDNRGLGVVRDHLELLATNSSLSSEARKALDDKDGMAKQYTLVEEKSLEDEVHEATIAAIRNPNPQVFADLMQKSLDSKGSTRVRNQFIKTSSDIKNFDPKKGSLETFANIATIILTHQTPEKAAEFRDLILKVTTSPKLTETRSQELLSILADTTIRHGTDEQKKNLISAVLITNNEKAMQTMALATIKDDKLKNDKLESEGKTYKHDTLRSILNSPERKKLLDSFRLSQLKQVQSQLFTQYKEALDDLNSPSRKELLDQLNTKYKTELSKLNTSDRKEALDELITEHKKALDTLYSDEQIELLDKLNIQRDEILDHKTTQYDKLLDQLSAFTEHRETLHNHPILIRSVATRAVTESDDKERTAMLDAAFHLAKTNPTTLSRLNTKDITTSEEAQKALIESIVEHISKINIYSKERRNALVAIADYTKDKYEDKLSQYLTDAVKKQDPSMRDLATIRTYSSIPVDIMILSRDELNNFSRESKWAQEDKDSEERIKREKESKIKVYDSSLDKAEQVIIPKKSLAQDFQERATTILATTRDRKENFRSLVWEANSIGDEWEKRQVVTAIADVAFKHDTSSYVMQSTRHEHIEDIVRLFGSKYAEELQASATKNNAQDKLIDAALLSTKETLIQDLGRSYEEFVASVQASPKNEQLLSTSLETLRYNDPSKLVLEFGSKEQRKQFIKSRIITTPPKTSFGDTAILETTKDNIGILTNTTLSISSEDSRKENIDLIISNTVSLATPALKKSGVERLATILLSEANTQEYVESLVNNTLKYCPPSSVEILTKTIIESKQENAISHLIDTAYGQASDSKLEKLASAIIESNHESSISRLIDTAYDQASDEHFDKLKAIIEESSSQHAKDYLAGKFKDIQKTEEVAVVPDYDEHPSYRLHGYDDYDDRPLARSDSFQLSNNSSFVNIGDLLTNESAREAAATKIQALARGNAGRKVAKAEATRKAAEQVAKEGKAAGVIQRAVRRANAREELANRKGAKAEADKAAVEQERETAATTIQKVVRGHAGRKVAKTEAEKQAAEQAAKEGKAAGVIQRAVRGSQAKTELANRKGAKAEADKAAVEQERETAATTIQKVVRGLAGRKFAKAEAEKQAAIAQERETAATKIQALARGNAGRKVAKAEVDRAAARDSVVQDETDMRAGIATEALNEIESLKQQMAKELAEAREKETTRKAAETLQANIDRAIQSPSEQLGAPSKPQADRPRGARGTTSPEVSSVKTVRETVKADVKTTVLAQEEPVLEQVAAKPKTQEAVPPLETTPSPKPIRRSPGVTKVADSITVQDAPLDVPLQSTAADLAHQPTKQQADRPRGSRGTTSPEVSGVNTVRETVKADVKTTVLAQEEPVLEQVAAKPKTQEAVPPLETTPSPKPVRREIGGTKQANTELNTQASGKAAKEIARQESQKQADSILSGTIDEVIGKERLEAQATRRLNEEMASELLAEKAVEEAKNAIPLAIEDNPTRKVVQEAASKAAGKDSSQTMGAISALEQRQKEKVAEAERQAAKETKDLQNKAAGVIQRAVRGSQAKTELANRKGAKAEADKASEVEQEREAAATKIQALARGHLGRKKSKQALQELREKSVQTFDEPERKAIKEPVLSPNLQAKAPLADSSIPEELPLTKADKAELKAAKVAKKRERTGHDARAEARTEARLERLNKLKAERQAKEKEIADKKAKEIADKKQKEQDTKKAQYDKDKAKKDKEKQRKIATSEDEKQKQIEQRQKEKEAKLQKSEAESEAARQAKEKRDQERKAIEQAKADRKALERAKEEVERKTQQEAKEKAALQTIQSAGRSKLAQDTMAQLRADKAAKEESERQAILSDTIAVVEEKEAADVHLDAILDAALDEHTNPPPQQETRLILHPTAAHHSPDMVKAGAIVAKVTHELVEVHPTPAIQQTKSLPAPQANIEQRKLINNMQNIVNNLPSNIPQRADFKAHLNAWSNVVEQIANGVYPEGLSEYRKAIETSSEAFGRNTPAGKLLGELSANLERYQKMNAPKEYDPPSSGSHKHFSPSDDIDHAQATHKNHTKAWQEVGRISNDDTKIAVVTFVEPGKDKDDPKNHVKYVLSDYNSETRTGKLTKISYGKNVSDAIFPPQESEGKTSVMGIVNGQPIFIVPPTKPQNVTLHKIESDRDIEVTHQELQSNTRAFNIQRKVNVQHTHDFDIHHSTSSTVKLEL